MNDRLIHLFLFYVASFFFVFLAFLFFSVKKPKNYFEPKTSQNMIAIRGNIGTKNFSVAVSDKIYALYVYPMFIDKTKEDMFYDLISIYSGVDKDVLKKRILNGLKRGQQRIRLFFMNLKTKQQLLRLKKVLDYYRVFLSYRGIRRGYDIEVVGFKRKYPFDDTLEPILGRYQMNLAKFDGLEKYYNNYLYPKQDGYIKGKEDVLGNIIFDKDVRVKYPINGNNLLLNISLPLQKKIENLIDEKRADYNASEILVAVMRNDGKIVALASSNRYNPNRVTASQVKNMRISAIRKLYEPGSVMKPIVFSLLLHFNKVNPYEVLNGYKGRWKPKWRKTPIRDDEKKSWMSAEDAIVYSSNIVISQLSLRLTNYELLNGLKKFGLGKKSGIDLPYENKGYLRSLKELQFPIYKSTTSYGYGIFLNFIQLLRAYNVFNNRGYLVTPSIANRGVKEKRIISPENAETMKRILRKVVLKGTGKKAFVKDVWTAGKTGTAHVVVNNKYRGIYNSSFFGFADDGTNSYTIGVVCFEIKKGFPYYFASETAVPIFKDVVELLKNENLLKGEK